MIKNKKGFTLIELLIVIAIIGILSAIVFAALTSARNKGANASIKSSLSSLRTKAQVIYELSSNSSFETLCTSGSDSNVDSILTSIVNNSPATNIDRTLGNGGDQLDVTCHSDPTNKSKWLVSAPLDPTGSGYWCVDWSGKSRAHASVVAGGALDCP